MLAQAWDYESVSKLFELPLFDLLLQAQTLQRQYFKPNEIQLSTLLNIKTGACPEDCSYCTQSAHYKTALKKEKLFDVEEVLAKAKQAKEAGSERFCMGAAWKYPPKKDFPLVLEMIKGIKALGLEACVTLGSLDEEQALQLKEAGLDFYNHNLDTSPEYYSKIISTRSFQDRLDTIENVRKADLSVCCGAILGLGESRADRINLLLELKKLSKAPESIPINKLIPMPGTPLQNAEPIDNFEFIRNIAVARILFPSSYVRLSAGRMDMSEEMQALCLFAGANSIFYGEKLLTSDNPDTEADKALFAKLSLNKKPCAQTQTC